MSNTRQHSAGKYDATLGSLLESEFGVAGEVKEQIVKMVSNEYRDFQQLREDKQVRHTSPNHTNHLILKARPPFQPSKVPSRGLSVIGKSPRTFV